MVQKIITAFRAKHKFNLSNERLQKQAEKWANVIENEEAIEAFIDNADVEYLQEIAKLDDALRAKAPKDKEEVEEPAETKKEEPEWKKEIDALKAQLEKQNTDSLVENRKKELQTALNGANEAFLKQVNRLDVSKYTDEDFNALKAELITDAESLKIEASKNNPFFGGANPQTTMKDEKAKDIASRI